MDNAIYFNAPIELWRGFMEKPQKVLSDVLDYATAEFESEEEATNKLGVSYRDWLKCYENGVKLRNRKYSGVVFSIHREWYWEYRNHEKDDYDKLLLLALLALRSISYNKRITLSNSAFMFCRMAGYGRMDEIRNITYNKEADRWSEPVTGIFRYMKTAKMMGYYCEKLRLDLMLRLDNFHCYSQKGKRGFVFVFGTDKSREGYIRELHAYINRTKDSERNKLKNSIKDMVK